MKKINAGIMLPFLLISATANSAEVYYRDGNILDLYGKLDARHVFTTNQSQGDATYARLGFKGETRILDTLVGYGQWEYNIQANKEESASDAATRIGFAGLKMSQYGSFNYGRNYGVIYDVEAMTDVLPIFSAATYTASDNFMTARANNLATYRNEGFFGMVSGVNIALQYQGSNGGANENVSGRDDVFSQNGQGWGISANYEFIPGFTFAGAYSDSARTYAQRFYTGNNASHAQTWATGMKYDDNGVYMAVTYSETRNTTRLVGAKAVDSHTPRKIPAVADKTQNLELVAQYQFDSGLRPSIGYLSSQASLRNSGKVATVRYIDIGAYYYFNKNMVFYTDYKVNLLNNNDPRPGLSVDSADAVGVGLTYQF